jgi:hypothetical protein
MVVWNCMFAFPDGGGRRADDDQREETRVCDS